MWQCNSFVHKKTFSNFLLTGQQGPYIMPQTGSFRAYQCLSSRLQLKMSVRRPRGEDDEQGSGADDHQQRHAPRRIRPALSLRSVVRRAVATETIQQIVLNLEPVIRRVVREEIQNFLSEHGQLPYRCHALRIPEVEVSPPLKLVFAKRLMLPIFTNNKLVDIANNTIEIQLVDARTNHLITPTNTNLGSSIRLEVLVLDGGFRCEDGEGWTDDQFNTAILEAREGKRPLLVGTLNVTMSHQGVAKIDDVSFTDNSSWIRSRKFRIGVRIMQQAIMGRIQEAVSESFTVKDHRGELYKKHFPPLLTDNVWRLKNIGKNGPIDKRLESEGIKNVQDFLKLNTIDPDKLKNLVGMSDRQWSATLNHAKTCDTGGKCYVFKSDGCDLTFSPIGEILAARIGGQICSLQELHPQQMVPVKQLAIQAYQRWDQLEEMVDEMALVANKSLIPFRQEKLTSSGIAANYIDQAEAMMENSFWEPSESQESMVGLGSQNAKYLDNIGTATSNAAMASNNSTLDSAAAVAANDALYSSPSTSAGNHFSWQNSTNLGCWDQVD